MRDVHSLTDAMSWVLVYPYLWQCTREKMHCGSQLHDNKPNQKLIVFHFWQTPQLNLSKWTQPSIFKIFLHSNVKKPVWKKSFLINNAKGFRSFCFVSINRSLRSPMDLSIVCETKLFFRLLLCCFFFFVYIGGIRFSWMFIVNHLEIYANRMQCERTLGSLVHWSWCDFLQKFTGCHIYVCLFVNQLLYRNKILQIQWWWWWSFSCHTWSWPIPLRIDS